MPRFDLCIIPVVVAVLVEGEVEEDEVVEVVGGESGSGMGPGTRNQFKSINIPIQRYDLSTDTLENDVKHRHRNLFYVCVYC